MHPPNVRLSRQDALRSCSPPWQSRLAIRSLVPQALPAASPILALDVARLIHSQLSHLPPSSKLLHRLSLLLAWPGSVLFRSLALRSPSQRTLLRTSSPGLSSSTGASAMAGQSAAKEKMPQCHKAYLGAPIHTFACMYEIQATIQMK